MKMIVAIALIVASFFLMQFEVDKPDPTTDPLRGAGCAITGTTEGATTHITASGCADASALHLGVALDLEKTDVRVVLEVDGSTIRGVTADDVPADVELRSVVAAYVDAQFPGTVVALFTEESSS